MDSDHGMLNSDGDLWQHQRTEDFAEVPYYVWRDRYRSIRTVQNVFVVCAAKDRVEVRIEPRSAADCPETLMASVAGFPPRSGRQPTPVSQEQSGKLDVLAAGVIDDSEMDFTHGSSDSSFIQRVLRAFSTRTSNRNDLQHFAHATIKVRGRDLGFGTLQQFLRNQDLELADN